jgi:hypothetical protein
MNSLLLSSEKRQQELEDKTPKPQSVYGENAHEFLKNHSEVRTEMIVPLLIKDKDGSQVNLKASSAMDMALKRHELEQERKLYVKELHLHDHH